jgi:hypothetical protein
MRSINGGNAMPDMIEPTPSERDEQIYEAWQSGKTLRVCAREFSTSVIEVERAIDRCLPIFNTASEMRAYKREIRRTEDVTAQCAFFRQLTSTNH